MNQDLLPGTHELIRELMQRLVSGESFDNPKLRRLAEQSFGGTRAQGVYSPRDAYDALETAVNEYLRENLAPVLLANDAEALPKLRALVDRLPTQWAAPVSR